MNDQTMLELFTELHMQDDIGMYYCGKRINTHNHEYGPQIKSHYLFVLVNKGTAVMLPENRVRFGECDMLVMLPGERIHYKALENWSISWLGLYGSTVAKYVELFGITPQNPTMRISLYNELKAVMDKIYDLSNDQSLSSKLSIVGLIYEFFAILLKCSGESPKSEFVNASLKIIEYNYCTNISVEKIAELLRVDPAYFSRKFTEKMGLSPKKYIINKRLERAKELLRSTDASIYEVSNSVGYEDQFYFYRIFKKYTKLSPSEYRSINTRL